jgi:hypothetical protein
VFERRGPEVLRDPWAARDAYVGVLLGATTPEEFLAEHAVVEAGSGPGATPDTAVEALTLLECQRHALLMYTSCGWFFNDLAGIETTQVMRYAARCLDLLAELGEDPPGAAVLDELARAQSNDPGEGDGRAIWQRYVDTSRVDPGRVAAHLALVDLLAGDAASERITGFDAARELHETVHRGGVVVCVGVVALTQRRTGRTTRWAYAAVHLGGLEVFGAVRPAADDPRRDREDIAALEAATRRGARVTALLRMVVDWFGPREFGLEHALPGAGEDLLRATADGLADRFVAAYDQLRTDHHDTLAALAVAGTPLAPELRGPIEAALARRLDAALAACAGSTDPVDYRAVRALAREAREEGVRLSSPHAAAMLERAVTQAAGAAAEAAEPAAIVAATGMVTLARELALDVDLAAAQELVHAALAEDGGAGLDADARRRMTPLARRLGIFAPLPETHRF